MKRFISDKVQGKKINDVVFEASQATIEASQKNNGDKVVNGAFGTFFDESGELFTFNTVYTLFNQVERVQIAKYASCIPGPKSFRDAVKDWLFTNNNVTIDSEVISTPGGTGALSSTVKNTLAPRDTVIYPKIGWGPYKTIAAQHNVNIATYDMFDGDKFAIDSFKQTTSEVMNSEGKILVFINDPCQNPTGYTMTNKEWDEVLRHLNRLADKGPVVLLHDIAYIDFHKQAHYGRIFNKFANLSENMLVVLAFSASKTMTAYGMRVGAQVLISSNKDERIAFKHACENTARGVWSTVNNGGMMTFSSLVNNKSANAEYLKEKKWMMNLLDERASIFMDEAKKAGLDLYPYKEGFFITLKVPDDKQKDVLHDALKNDGIFFVNITGGLRIAICSIQINKLKGLAQRIKDVMKTL